MGIFASLSKSVNLRNICWLLVTTDHVFFYDYSTTPCAAKRSILSRYFDRFLSVEAVYHPGFMVDS